MKTTNFNVLKMAFFLFVGLSITLTSCSGKDGDDGIDGIDGINGEQGPQGPAGEDGNANVIASDWIPIQWDNSPGLFEATMDIGVSEVNLNELIETGGVVMVFFRAKAEEIYYTFTLPFLFQNASYNFYIISDETSGRIRVEASDPEGKLIIPIQNDVDNYALRYVLVPANVADQTGLADNIPASFEDASTLLGID